jgi:hypothetical protein
MFRFFNVDFHQVWWGDSGQDQANNGCRSIASFLIGNWDLELLANLATI